MTTIMILAVYGLAYAVRNLNGPFNMIGIVRNRAISFHIFFYELLTCPFCVGFWSGVIVYTIGFLFRGFAVGDMLLWGLAGSVITPLMDRLFELVGTLNSND